MSWCHWLTGNKLLECRESRRHAVLAAPQLMEDGRSECIYGWTSRFDIERIDGNGWNLRNGDKFLLADINGDGQQEIIVLSPDGAWIGVINEQGGGLVAGWIGHDWVNPPGGAGASGWNLHSGDKFLVADINGDGREELVVVSPDGEWIGVINEQGGSLVAGWIGHDWVNPPGGGGASGWNLRSGDKFLAADINGDGRKEIVVQNPDGEWIGVINEQGGSLFAGWIGHDWVYGGAGGNRGTLRIAIRIRLAYDAGVPQNLRAAAETRWQNGIQNVWSNRFLLRRSFGTCLPEEYEVLAVCEFVNSNEHHTVRIQNGSGRANMTNWFITDSAGTAAHEAGHMLGFSDEYSDSNCSNRTVTSDGSIMQTTAGSPQLRHYELFLLWLCHRAECGFHFA